MFRPIPLEGGGEELESDDVNELRTRSMLYSPYLLANKAMKPLCMTHKENTWISFSPTSAILMNGSPFNGSNNVFQIDDPVHLPCTKIKDIPSSRYLHREA